MTGMKKNQPPNAPDHIAAEVPPTDASSNLPERLAPPPWPSAHSASDTEPLPQQAVRPIRLLDAPGGTVDGIAALSGGSAR